jgi:hypothetical protein
MIPHIAPFVKSEKKEVAMAPLSEELHNYSLTGLTGMSDVLVEIIENQAPNYHLPAEFVQSLEELRWDIDREIDAGLNDMEAFEGQVMARAILVSGGQKSSLSARTVQITLIASSPFGPMLNRTGA